MSSSLDLLLLLALILLNGVFALSEIALVTSRKARLSDLISARKNDNDKSNTEENDNEKK